jgi:hypothetical protein
MIRIDDFKCKATLKAAALVSVLLLLVAVAGFGQVNLTAGPGTITMPDGTVVPMWGYTCGTAVSTSTATCAPLSGANIATSSAAMGALGGVYVINGGSGYTSAPTVTISAPTGTITGVTNLTATANAVVSGGQVVGFSVTSHGAGYIAAPTVMLSGGGGTGAVAAASPAWSPVMITVPSGTTAAPAALTINLTNNLSFTPAAGGTANTIPTSIVIVGQVGGGLGGTPSRTQSPSHANAQGCPTWFIASGATPPGTPCTTAAAAAGGVSGAPPAQANRVQSMGAEVTAGATTSLTWAGLKPGTYLLESGTHPSIQVPMGLIGVLVVTTAPSGTTAGTAYPGVAANTTTGTVAVPAVQYNAEVPLEFSEVDPVQNKEVDLAVRTAGFSETKVWSGMPIEPNTGLPGCGNPASSSYHTCYPPAVNYTPFYFLINGLAFDKASPAPSLFAATAGVTTATPPAPVTTGIAGTVLVRLVNAGLRMHVPSIVGSQTAGFSGTGAAATVSGFTLIAEDGNVIPGVAPAGAAAAPAAPRVQTDVFMAAGKTFDVMVNVPATPTGATAPPSLPVYDRELSLSGNSSVRDAGMLAYIGVNGAGLPVAGGSGVFTAAIANPDAYPSVIPCATGATSCIPLVITDPSKGVIANDINVYGVALSTPPTAGTLTCNALPGSPVIGICANGTFTYTPNAGTTADSFVYCANGSPAVTPSTTAAPSLCATVTLAATTLSGNPVANNITFTSKMATFLKIASPGVLSVDTDPNSLPLQVVLSSVTPTGVTINMDSQGGFTASATAAGTYSFTYVAQNSQGALSNSATVTLIFPPPSNLKVNVLDAQLYNNCNGNSTCIAGLTPIGDYRWIIEEDKTFWVDPNCTTSGTTATTTPGCPAAVATGGTIPVFGVQFHTSNMDYVAQGCTGPLSCEGGQTMLDTRPGSTTFGQHVNAVCDVGNGACRPDTTGNGFTAVNPSQVALDPAKRYYISVLPGDAANPYPAYVGQPVCSTTGGTSTTGTCGHTISGAPIPAACNILGGPSACTTTSAFTQPVTVLTLPTPLPTGKLSVIVFEDDFPLNGEQDGGGGNGTVAPIEPGLGGFNIVLWDTYGGLGDVTGQDTNDMFNQSLSNSLAGTIDPTTGLDACPVTATPSGPNGAGFGVPGAPPSGGITGMIVTCPKYESNGTTLSPLAGQAVIANLMPDKFSVQAYPAADRIARGEQWVQTNTLDGQHPHDSFIRIGEPSYFQEYGPAGYHVSIGFANPAIINARAKDVCAGAGTPGAVGPCSNTIDGQVDVERLSRTPDQRLYPSGSRDAFAWTQCWVSLGDPDGEDFMFTFCDASGNFKFTGVPGGNWRLTVGDQWNDQIIDGLSTPANVGCVPTPPASTCSGGISTLHMGNIGAQQWQANLYTRTYIDDNKDGIWEPGEIGIPFLYTRIRYRDGHNANSALTDFNGVVNYNETFPLFNWYVVEADTTRYKTTGIHTVYDAGGPADGSPSCGSAARPCGTSTAYSFLANTYEAVPLPADLSVPGAVYCAKADCAAEAASFAAGTAIPSTGAAGLSTGRIDPPWVVAEGWSGMTSQGNWIDIGKAPYASCPPACATVTSTPPGATAPTTTQVAENGGIYGLIQYASTRPFDDASQMIQQPWEPNIPHVTVNLYQEGFAGDGVTPTLTLVDTTQSSSWDDWAQGFYPSSTAGSTGATGEKPYMSCPGQGTNVTGSPNQDLFFFSLFDQPNYLDWYNSVHNGGTLHTLPYNSQYKCYDAMHIWNQLQPANYDGKYIFPSVLGIQPSGANAGKLVTTVGATNGVAASMAGTNCTICVANPDSTDKWRFGSPMLPPGKYVVQVVMPPGYEVYKEEDKNLLIGDNFIAPVTQEFAGLGTDIFILPDQASVASMYDQSAAGFNSSNYQDSTTGLGLSDELSGVPGYPGFQDPVWPCVGEMRIVPDYLSLFPQVHEVAPFAGATRPLCDRKEVTLANQMSVSVKFALFTSTHIASKFTGVITDDFTSEFDPFSPQFGEKFAPPNMPISTKDYLGNEISRVYSDHWGVYDGLTFSSWAVNPPNITGYSPSLMTQCMNDPGPILDTRPGSPTNGQMIPDPLYNSAYSDFCYEEPYMPGLTNYTDTPVVPTEAFVGAAYNSPDCSYPDATPAIKEVDGDGIGPWVSKTGVTLTITALGDQPTNNSAYSGPSANAAPFNMKTVTRHYGFGSQCTSPTAGSTTCSTLSSVTIGGRPAVIDSWSDTQILVTVPTGVPNCAIQQQAQYGGSPAQCGQLQITAGNGKQSIDTVTVTIGGKAPAFHVGANQSIQSAIDAAMPGDLIIVDPTCTTTGTTTTAACSITATQTRSTAAHSEMLIMWKPVRLQGVGAASSIISANANPAGKLLDPWRRHINCLFGLTLQGVPEGAPIPVPNSTPPATTPAVYDSTKTYSCPDTGIPGDVWNDFNGQTNMPQIDRLPLEATVGWDATQNGNLAEQLQEPSLMGAFEGAGITVLGKGVDFHGANPWSDGNEGGAFPTGTTLLTGVGPDPTALPVGDANSFCHTSATVTANPFPSNFTCNPSSIDGLAIINSSQGGGGIFAHGWAHHLQIANNRIYNNAGTLTGGISVGQGEFPTPYLVGSTTNAAPGSCSDGTGLTTNQHEPYCLQLQVNVHNNYITNNSSLGDELFSGTLSGGGGVTFCTGNDYYKFNYNWVCGNLSSGEGGGLVHLGEIQDGDIEHNSIVLNQSNNPTIPTNGGGIQVMGTPDTDPICGTQIDTDCPPGLSDGIGRGLTINGNLIQANMAESGSGGGIRLQQVNGTDVSTFPSQPTLWNGVSITNNMIVNNVAGWDGAGISLQDSLNVSIINNTIASNDALASSGVLTQSIGTPQASAPAGSCVNAAGTASCPQSAGVTSTQNSTLLTTTFTGLTITCPFGTAYPCMAISNPLLQNNVIWQNRSFEIGVSTATGLGNLNQQNLVTLFDAFTAAAAPVQTASGQCTTGVSYWDIGVRGDTAPNNHTGGLLNPTYSVLDDPTDYPGGSNLGNNPSIISQYCNGSRVPPTCSVTDGCGGPNGYGVPPGIVDAASPNPVFTLTPSATVDEGNNWINVSWGPLALSDDSLTGGANGNYGGGPLFANYALAATSPAIDYIPLTSATLPTATNPTLSLDFFGNPRPDSANPNHFDIGAVEFQGGSGVATLTSISPTTGAQGTVVPVTITGTGLTLASAVNVSGTGITVSNFAAVSATTVTATFTIAPTATLSARNVTVTTPAGTSNAVTFTVVAPPVPTLTSIAPATELRGTSIPVVLTGTNFVAGATVVAAPAAAGFTISGVTVVNLTTITATFASTTAAAIGNVNIEVVTGGGASNTLPFAITGPVLTSISPTSNNRGTTTPVPITLTGTGLTGATAVNFSGNGISVTGVTVVNDTTVTASISIAAFATAGARNVTVTAPGGNSNPVTFTVTVPPAGLFSIAPNTGARGTAQPVVLTGISLTGATSVNVTGGGITVSGLTVVSDTQVNATFTISPTAALTARNVTVTTPTGTTTPVTFTVVNPGTPIINSITPASGFRRTAAAANPVAVVIAGSNFTAGSTVNVVAPANGLTVTGVTIVSPTQINATFNTTTTAVIGPRSITVTNPGGVSNAVTYTVLGPVLTSIAPTSALRGQGAAVPVSLFGSGLTGATAVTVSGGGITVGAITVVSDTQVNTSFTISAGAAGTARTVSVTAPGGVSNTVPFTVTIPPTPTLTSISPATGVRGTAVLVMLTGTNFLVNETTVAVSGGGITVSGVAVTSPTTLSATFTITAAAAATARTVTATVAGAAAASNTVPFTVLGPTLTSISPNTGLRGTTVPVTFTGTNLTGTTGVSGLGAGVSLVAGSLTVVNSTTVTASLAISTTATVSIRNIGLTTPIGTTNTIPFTVTGATLTAISPTSATHPATGTLAVPVTITGTNLTGTTALTGLGTGVTLAAGSLASTSTTITATLNVASTATVGARTIGATTAAGATTNTVTFTVN